MRKANITIVEKALIKAFGGTWEKEDNGPGDYYLTKTFGKFIVFFTRRKKQGLIRPGFDWSILLNKKRLLSFSMIGETKPTHQEAIRELERKLKDLEFIVKNMKG